MSGGSKRRTDSAELVTSFRSLGRMLLSNDFPANGGRWMPSLKRPSMAEKYGNSVSESTNTASSEGTTAWRTENTVVAENVALFTDENSSSLGT